MSLRTRLVLLVLGAVVVPLVTVAALLIADNRSLTSGVALAVLVGTAVIALLASWLLYRFVDRWITKPVAQFTAAARQLATGDLTHIDLVLPEGGPELDELADAFGGMIDHVRRSVDELSTSRRELRRSIERVGTALESTHDRQTIVEVLLETVTVTVQGSATVFWLFRAGGLEAVATQGAKGVRGRRLARGAGLAGGAAQSGEVVLASAGPALDAAEPAADAALAVPVRAGDRLYGVLAVYGRDRGGVFSAEDAETVGVLAHQAEAAIYNTFLHEEASRLSITDGLTGLWNRRQFDFSIGQEVDRASRFREPFSVVMLDIDDFREVNNRYGHQVGDAVLIDLARRLTDATREVDLVARYGGEEFVLLLPRTSVEGARQLGEKVRASVASAPFEVDDLVLGLTVSAGTATYPEDGTAARELVGAADAALYRAKGMGKDRVVTAEECRTASDLG